MLRFIFAGLLWDLPMSVVCQKVSAGEGKVVAKENQGLGAGSPHFLIQGFYPGGGGRDTELSSGEIGT